MKGFIEVSLHGERALIATSAIVGLYDKGKEGCVLSLNSVAIGINQPGPAVYLQQSYDEIVALLKKA